MESAFVARELKSKAHARRHAFHPSSESEPGSCNLLPELDCGGLPCKSAICVSRASVSSLNRHSLARARLFIGPSI